MDTIGQRRSTRGTLFVLVLAGLVVVALYLFLTGSGQSVGRVSDEADGQNDPVVAARPPEVIVRPGVVSRQTPALVIQKTLGEIAANERKLGLALVPTRIVKVQLLDEGEFYELGNGGAMAPDDGPGWMVEVIGTFVEDARQPGSVLVGTRGYYRWDDAGSGGTSFVECWRGDVARVAEGVAACVGPPN